MPLDRPALAAPRGQDIWPQRCRFTARLKLSPAHQLKWSSEPPHHCQDELGRGKLCLITKGRPQRRRQPGSGTTDPCQSLPTPPNPPHC